MKISPLSFILLSHYNYLLCLFYIIIEKNLSKSWTPNKMLSERRRGPQSFPTSYQIYSAVFDNFSHDLLKCLAQCPSQDSLEIEQVILAVGSIGTKVFLVKYNSIRTTSCILRHTGHLLIWILKKIQERFFFNLNLNFLEKNLYPVGCFVLDTK